MVRRTRPGISTFSGAQLRPIVRCFASPRNDVACTSAPPVCPLHVDRQTTSGVFPMAQAKRIVLASRPVGEPKPSDFRLEETPVPTPGDGQVLLRTIWLSLD